MLKHAFGSATEGIYLRTRSDGKLFNLFRLRAKSKVQLKCLHDLLFADDAAVIAHSAEELQQLMTHFSEACRDFGLTISLRKTQVMGQDVDSKPSISIFDHELDVVHDFVYLGSTISDSLSLDTELDKRIGRAATTMSRLTKRVDQWQADRAHQNPGIQSLRPQHPPLWQRILDLESPSGKETQCIPHALSSLRFAHHLAGQSR